MEGKKTYDRIFARGWSAAVKERFGINTAKLLRITRSGGLGLSPANVEVYDYLWNNRLDLFRPEYLRVFEKNDKRNN